MPLIAPLASGALLLALSIKSPAAAHLVRRALGALPFRVSQAFLIKVFSWLFGVSLLYSASSALSSIALNNWRVFSDKDRWTWSEEIAVVTGGCSGIGEEIVKALASRHVKVVILDTAPLPERLSNVAALYIKCDVTDAEAVQAAATKTGTELGPPSILVNNAGIGNDMAIFDCPPDRVKKTVEVNLTSHWYTLSAFGPEMARRNKGHIVEIASMSSFVSQGQFSAYSATKLALVALCESLREQLRLWYRSPDVHVTIVHPLWVATPLVASRQALIEKHSGKMMTPQFVGKAVADQIFRCRGAQLVLPESHSFLRTTRAWPLWLFDGLKSLQAISREELEREARSSR